jgi:hypothetical protein
LNSGSDAKLAGNVDNNNSDSNQLAVVNTDSKFNSFKEKMRGFGTTVADNIQGRIAPSTMAKCGYLLKMDIPISTPNPFSLSFGEANSYRNASSYRQLNAAPDYKWRSYYFVLRTGSVYILPYENSPKSDFHFTLEQITEVKELDSLLTGQPHSFQITIYYEMDPQEYESEYTRTVIVNFLGQPIYTTETSQPIHCCDCKYTLVLSANSQVEQESWVRELSSAASGVKLRDKAGELGESALGFGKSALGLGVKVGVSTLAVVAASNMGARAGNRVVRRKY